MARIKYSDLVAWIEKHPEYKKTIEFDVPARQALYIEFDSPAPRRDLDSENYPTTEAAEVVIDRGKDGLVYGIEIV